MKKEIVYSTCGELFYDCCISDFDIGCTYYSGVKIEVNIEDLIWEHTVDVIVERMEERLFEVVGEAAEDNLHLSEERRKDLHNIIVEFMKLNAKITCYTVEDIEEHVLTIDDLT